jgi:hypothetical protein
MARNMSVQSKNAIIRLLLAHFVQTQPRRIALRPRRGRATDDQNERIPIFEDRGFALDKVDDK